jgi:hypothetical protein
MNKFFTHISFIVLLIILIFFSCKKEKKATIISKTSSDSILKKPLIEKKVTEKINTDTIQKPLVESFGYRFIIDGDFDGDGQKEKLIEHYISTIDNKETNKFYENLKDFEQLMDLTINKKPFSFMLSDNKQIDTLKICDGYQQNGISYMRNEGDLNGDGRDDLSLVINYTDYSNTNHCSIMSYKGSKWEEIYSFNIWDWQLPNLPGTFNDYGLFGIANKQIVSKDDASEKEFKEFEGLIKKIKNNKIKIVCRNEEAMEETKIVNLTGK